MHDSQLQQDVVTLVTIVAHLCFIGTTVGMICCHSCHEVEPVDWNLSLYHTYQNTSDMVPLLGLAICFDQAGIC